MTEEHDAYKRAEFLGSSCPRAPHEQPGLLKCNFRAGITMYVASSPRRPSKVSLLKAKFRGICALRYIAGATCKFVCEMVWVELPFVHGINYGLRAFTRLKVGTPMLMIPSSAGVIKNC